MLKRHTAAVLLALTLTTMASAQERPISEVRTGLPSGAFAGSARVAAHGDEFLAIWLSQWRGGQAARVDMTGDPIDKTPIGLPVSGRYAFWNDGRWIVVGTEGWVRLSEEGALLDAQPRPYDGPAFDFADAVWSGSSLYVLALTGAPPQQLVLHTFDGQLKRTSSSAIGGRGAMPYGIHSDGDTALVFFTPAGGNEPLTAALFDSAGTFVRQRIVFTPPDDREVVSAGSRGTGSGYVIVSWTPTMRFFPGTYSSHTFGYDLVPGPARPLGQAMSPAFAPAMPWDGQALNLFLVDGRVVALRIGDDGLVVEKAESAILPGESVSHVAAGAIRGTTLIVQTGTSGQFNQTPIYVAARAGSSAAGIMSDQPFPLDVGGSEQDAPAAASNATQSLVAWREATTASHPYAIFATRVAGSGAVLDPKSIHIADTPCRTSRPAVAAIGDGFLVAWRDVAGPRLASVSAAGAVRLTQLEFTASACVNRTPLIIAGDTEALVIWTRPGGGNANGTVLGMRVRGDGTLIDALPLTLGVAVGAVHGASNGTDYLVTWDNNFTRVTGGGTVLDLSGNSFLGYSTFVTAAWWNGRTYSVLHGDAAQRKITRVDTRGRVSKTSATIATPPLGNAVNPACDASGCSVIFGTTALRELRAEDDGVTATIVLLDALPVASPVSQIAALRTSGGRLFAVYTRRDVTRPAAGAMRIFLRPMEGSRIRAARR